MNKLIARYRKYLVAAAAPFIPVSAFYLGVAPLHVPSGAVWYAFIVAELAALGVAGISNDPKPPVAPAG